MINPTTKNGVKEKAVSLWGKVGLCLCQHEKRAQTSNEINSNVKRPLWELRKLFDARTKALYQFITVSV